MATVPAPEHIAPQPNPTAIEAVEYPLKFTEQHEAELAEIKKVDQEIRLPEEDTKALQHYMEIMGSKVSPAQIGFDENDPANEIKPSEPKKPFLSAVAHGIVDFFPRVIENTVEDFRMTIRRKTSRETASKEPLKLAELRAAKLGQELPKDEVTHELPVAKLEEPSPKTTDAIQPILPHTPEGSTSNIVSFPTPATPVRSAIPQQTDKLAA